MSLEQFFTGESPEFYTLIRLRFLFQFKVQVFFYQERDPGVCSRGSRTLSRKKSRHLFKVFQVSDQFYIKEKVWAFLHKVLGFYTSYNGNAHDGWAGGVQFVPEVIFYMHGVILVLRDRKEHRHET